MTVISYLLIFLYTATLIYLLFGLISRKWMAVDEIEPRFTTGISVIVALRNESNNLPGLLSTLELQDFPRELWEVILVDDGSTDGGVELIMNFKTDIHLRLINLPEGQMGKKQALLFGISHARHPIIVFTDADCVLSPKWLSAIASNMHHYDLLQGEVRPVAAYGNMLSMFEALDYASLMAVSAASFSLGCPVIASSANLAFTTQKLKVDASTLRADISSGDDMFLLHYAKKVNGLRMGFASNNAIAVQTRFDGGLIGFFRRRSRWASKSLAYTDTQTILLGLLVLLLNIWLVTLLMLTTAGAIPPFLLLSVWLTKGLVDLLFLACYLYRTNQLKLLTVFIPLQVVYPFYIVLSSFVGFIKGTSWKGRPIN